MKRSVYLLLACVGMCVAALVLPPTHPSNAQMKLATEKVIGYGPISFEQLAPVQAPIAQPVVLAFAALDVMIAVGIVACAVAALMLLVSHLRSLDSSNLRQRYGLLEPPDVPHPYPIA